MEFRKRLTLEPRNALSWVDLALEHLVQGLPDKSRKSIAVALHLAPENRFVLRSASALFVEIDELDRALYVLEKSSRAKSDPWPIPL